MMIFYLSLDPFSLASQTDRTGPNAEINVDFFVKEREESRGGRNECRQINISTLQYKCLTVLLNVDSVN